MKLQRELNVTGIQDIIKLVRQCQPGVDLYTVYNTIIEMVSQKEKNYNYNLTIPLYTKIIGEQLYLENEQIYESPGKLNTEDSFVFNAEDEDKVEIDIEDEVMMLTNKLKNFTKSQIIDYYMFEQNYQEFKFLLEDVLIRSSR